MGGLGVSLLFFRQQHLRKSPIYQSTVEQLKSAEAVHALLGGNIHSTRGFVAGYFDAIGGTAVLELPLQSESGTKGVARVEAEAEWVGEDDAERRTKLQNRTDVRWLLRHLEVELLPAKGGTEQGAGQGGLAEGATLGGAQLGGATEPVVLYSIPARLPLSVWAPPRTPSKLPRWVRALFPTYGLGEDEGSAKLLQAAAGALCLHIVVAFAMRRKMQAQWAIRAAEDLLLLPESPAMHDLRTHAVRLALQEQAAGTYTPAALSTNAALYGVVTSAELAAYSPVHHSDSSSLDLLFAAERAGGRGPWRLTHVSLNDAGRKDKYLAATADLEGAQAAIYAMTNDFTSVSLPPAKGMPAASGRGEQGAPPAGG